MQPVGPDTPPTAELRSEHRVIEQVLDVLARLVDSPWRGEPAALAGLRDCVRFFRLFADACHHGKEEDLLFPVMEAAGIPREGGPIGVMLYEHRLGRQHVRAMAAALDGIDAGQPDAADRFTAEARAYIDLLRLHIRKEDDVLFVMGEHVTPPGEQTRLAGQFCQFRCQAFEGSTRDELIQLADKLSQQWK